jgi:hypothetical protein
MGLAAALLLCVSPASNGGDVNGDAANKSSGSAKSIAPVKGAKPAAKPAAPKAAPKDRPAGAGVSDAVKAWHDADI